MCGASANLMTRMGDCAKSYGECQYPTINVATPTTTACMVYVGYVRQWTK
jgi:hypothetical protein